LVAVKLSKGKIVLFRNFACFVQVTVILGLSDSDVLDLISKNICIAEAKQRV
jgi:hypothetical protein